MILISATLRTNSTKEVRRRITERDGLGLDTLGIKRDNQNRFSGKGFVRETLMQIITLLYFSLVLLNSYQLVLLQYFVYILFINKNIINKESIKQIINN